MYWVQLPAPHFCVSSRIIKLNP